jgi:dTDP-4-amino-4,6-dideoxygalactose transaminase
MPIPFNQSYIAPRSLEYVSKSLTSDKTSGDGEFTNKASQLLEQDLCVAKVLLTPSCTHALEMCALLLDLKPGDEVIIPSFTFVSSANAFVLHGAKPILADIRRDTLNIDETKLENLITSKTRAIVVVHYAGIACEMDHIMTLAKRHQLAVIEDNAHGLYGKYKDKFLGTIGDLATQSFHDTKNISCGEGGALLINNHKYIERAEIIRQKGTNRSKFFRGQVDKYTWVDIGSSYVMADILAAALLAQLEDAPAIQSARAHIWHYYFENLQDWSSRNNVCLPCIPDDCEQTYHMFYLLMPSLSDRTKLIKHLKKHSITASFHYQPLHLSDMGIKLGCDQYRCPITEKIADCLVRLPLYNGLTDGELKFVISTIEKYSAPKNKKLIPIISI